MRFRTRDSLRRSVRLGDSHLALERRHRLVQGHEQPHSSHGDLALGLGSGVTCKTLDGARALGLGSEGQFLDHGIHGRSDAQSQIFGQCFKCAANALVKRH